MDKKKDVLTTGQVAKICNVAPRTVSKWFDSGQLRGYRIPGSKDRRIPLSQLIRFMRAHGIPLNGLDGGTSRILLVDSEEGRNRAISEALEKDGRFEVKTAECGFDAGLIAEQFHPHVIFMDIMLEDINPKRICQIIRENTELQTQIETMQKALQKKGNSIKNTMNLVPIFAGENQRLKAEIEKLKTENQALLDDLETKQKSDLKNTQPTAEQKTETQKRLQELFKLQKESAEKMRLEKLKKEGQK